MNLFEKIKLAFVVSIPFVLMVLLLLIGVMIITYFLHKYSKINSSCYKGIKIILLIILIATFVATIGYYTIFNPVSEMSTPIT